uniref:Uncharacterized protein n=1 Tax=Parastrongyloides trichosuri TaxID=131310 RepID=A0A0N4Z1A0_PARTI
MRFIIFLLHIFTFPLIKGEMECISQFELYVGSLFYSSVYEQTATCDRCATFQGYVKGEKELKGKYSGCLDQLEWILGDLMEQNPFKIHGICGISGNGYSLVNEPYEFQEYNVTTTCTSEKSSKFINVDTQIRESGPIHAAMTSNTMSGERKITMYMVLYSILQIIISFYYTTS